MSNSLDIWYIIFQHCDLLSQLRLFSVCSEFYHSFFITDMYSIDPFYQHKLTNSTLKQKKFSRMIELNIELNDHVDDISFLTNLKRLIPNNKINQQSIQKLNLIELAFYNNKIKDISFMTNLKILHIHGFCNINQQSIQGLNLTELYAGHNNQIRDISFMSNLKKLYATQL